MSHNTLPAMELLKSYTTGVQTLGNLETIQYQVFIIEKKDDTEESGQGESILSCIASLRAWSHFVYFDAASRVVWIFHGGALNGFTARPDLSKIAADWAYALKPLFKGSFFKASDLSQCIGRPPVAGNAQAAPPSVPPSTPTQAVRASQVALLRTLKASAVAPGAGQDSTPIIPIPVRTVYTKFISAVYSTISYNLSRYHRTIEVDLHTFVHVPDSEQIQSNGRSATSTPLQCFTLDIYLASGGHLVISTKPENGRKLVPYQPSESPNNNPDVILLAPGGLMAVAVEASATPENATTQAWKEIVVAVLESKGIHIDSFNSTNRWTLVRAWPSTTAADSDTTLGTVFYWPEALCFRTDVAQSTSQDQSAMITEDTPSLIDPGQLAPSSWFYPAKEGGFVDSLHFAEDWLKAKGERDKIVEDRRRKRKEAEAAQRQTETAALTVASPFYTRSDLQAAGGVYPTPPDGILSQIASAAPASDTMTAPAPQDTPLPRNSLDFQPGEMMDIDMAAFGEGAKQRPSVQSRTSMQMDNSMSMGDDLFGNIDEDDEFGGHDITDADFSFFDEPDGDDDILGPTSDAPDQDIKIESDLFAEGLKPDDQKTSTADQLEAKAQEHAAMEEQKPDNEDVAEVEKVEETPREYQDITETRAVRTRSPLSPTSVRKKLFEYVIDSSEATTRGHSFFEAVPFKPSLLQSDTKYSSGGAFAFSPKDPSNANKRPASKIEKDIHMRSPPNKVPRLADLGRASKQQAVVKARQKDSDDSSFTSDASDDDDSLFEFEALSLVPSPIKGLFLDKRILALQDGDATSVASSPGSYMAGDDNPASGMTGSIQDRIDLLDAILKPLVSRIPSSALLPQSVDSDIMFITDPTLTSAGIVSVNSAASFEGPLLPTHKDFILISQTIAEQIIFGSFNLSPVTMTELSPVSDVAANKFNAIVPVRAAQAAMKSFHSGLTECDLLRFLCISDPVPEKSQAVKGQPQPPAKKGIVTGTQASDGIIVAANVLAIIPPPHVRIRRNEGLWDILPPALPFWEHLGLAPASGRKNLMAFCIYPGSEDMKSQVCMFMDYLGACYESCKLGTHHRSEDTGGSISTSRFVGLIPVKLSEKDDPLESAFRRLREVCVQLGKLLATVDWQRKKTATSGGEDPGRVDNFIIYMVNPFEDGRGVAELCAAFWLLFKAYGQAARSPMLQGPRPDLVLQIVPLREVASPSAPVVHDSIYFQKLARRVYDRCPPSIPDEEPSRLRINSGACIQLEQSLPKKIPFALSVEPPSDLLHENSHLHLAYARSQNGEWVTAAWTCATGRYQATVSYCLVGGRSFYEIAREIWNATIEIMQARRIVWRLCIAKAGLMEREELDAWSSLSMTPSQAANFITIIIALDPKPPISVIPNPVSANATQSAAPPIQTPVGTPQPGVSPDPHSLTPAGTPSASANDTTDVCSDPDAHLVDVGDETYGLILGHRANVTSSLADYRPSLASGYLFKPNVGGATSLDSREDHELKGPIIVGVHLVWIGQPPRNAPNTQAAQQQAQQAQQQPQASSPTDATASTPPSTQPPTPPAPNVSNYNGSTVTKIVGDSILKDYLSIYRNLGTLARARGLEGSLRGTLPWHVVVAMRGVRGLEGVFGNLGGN